MVEETEGLSLLVFVMVMEPEGVWRVTVTERLSDVDGEAVGPV